MASPDAVPDSLVAHLVQYRQSYHLPSTLRPLSHALADGVLRALFPHFSTTSPCQPAEVREELLLLQELLHRIMRSVAHWGTPPPPGCAEKFMGQLQALHTALMEDAAAIVAADPAAHSVDEVILAYPGFYAIAIHRAAHALWELGLPVVPRLLAERAHEKTGVDIHPGARIGPRFCIDHGTGVVIGETTVIGANVRLYQGVTLGALTVTKAMTGQKRHPTIEDNVVIYAGATILGGDTVVGRGSFVAGNAWVTFSVPPDSLVGRKSEVRPKGGGAESLLDFNI